MWLYYASLQLILLLVMHSNIYPPSSVELVFDAVSGIINLSSFDKQKAAAAIGLDKLTRSQFYKSLDGVGVALVIIVLLLLVIGAVFLISKRVKAL